MAFLVRDGPISDEQMYAQHFTMEGQPLPALKQEKNVPFHRQQEAEVKWSHWLVDMEEEAPAPEQKKLVDRYTKLWCVKQE